MLVKLFLSDFPLFVCVVQTKHQRLMWGFFVCLFCFDCSSFDLSKYLWITIYRLHLPSPQKNVVYSSILPMSPAPSWYYTVKLPLILYVELKNYFRHSQQVTNRGSK